MFDFFITLFGGVTSKEFAEVFILATKDREVMQSSLEFYKAQCDARQRRIDYLEDLILKKTGYVSDADQVKFDDAKVFQPIGGQNTWGKVKHELELRDRKLMQERNKQVR